MQNQKVLKESHRRALSETFNFLLPGQRSLASHRTAPGVWALRMQVQKAQFVRAQDELHLPGALLLPLQQPWIHMLRVS